MGIFALEKCGSLQNKLTENARNSAESAKNYRIPRCCEYFFLLILSLVKTDSVYLLSKKVYFLIDILAQNLHIYVGSSTEKFFEISNSRKKLRIDHPVWR